MAGKDFLKNICTKLGKSNKPIYAVMAIATVKGIARPIITMMDKDENPETKKYTAMREFLTEVVAIPTYWACGELAGKFGEKLNLPPDKKALAKHNFMFLGVCTAALVIIPALASATIRPIFNKIKEKNTQLKQNDSKLEYNKPAFKRQNKNYIFNHYNNFTTRGVEKLW